MSKIVAICTSEKKGTAKICVNEANLIYDFGIEGDAHAGKWHRQISLLELAKIEDFIAKGGNVKFGDFGENLVVDGIELDKLPIGKKIEVGETVLEVTQIGKKCHTKCEIFYRVGQCIMPIYGIFAKVIEGGKITLGDKVNLINE